MRWSASVAEWGRRETLLAAALGVSVPLVGAGVALGAPEVAVPGAVIAAVGAVIAVVLVMERVKLERKRERSDAGRHLLTAVSPVNEVDPTRIGVDAAAQSVLPGNRVPEYIARSKDAELRSALSDATTGEGPRIVVVQGPSKVGKSRSLFEALRRSFAGGWSPQIVAPVDGVSVRTVLTPGEGPDVDAGPAVLWLDDLEPFLNSGVNLRVLTEWNQAAADRIVVATYGGKGSVRLADARSSELASTAQEVLQHASVVTLEETSKIEIAGLRARLSSRDMAAVEHHGLAAFMVAGPLLERKLKTRHLHPGEPESPRGVACVRAVADWARCGRTDPIPLPVLRQLWDSRCPGADSDAFNIAIDWALEPVAGSIGLISRSAVGIVPFDYTVRLIDQEAGGAAPADEYWLAAIETAADELGITVGLRAYEQKRPEFALQAFRQATKSNSRRTAAVGGFNVGVIMEELGRPKEAIAAYDQVVAQYGNDTEPATRKQAANALVNKGTTLAKLGRPEQAIAAYDQVISQYGNDTEPATREPAANALVNKGTALREMGRTEEELAAYDQVVATYGSDTEPATREPAANALVNKGITLGELGRPEQAIAVYEQVIAHYSNDTAPLIRQHAVNAMLYMGITLGELGRPDQAIAANEQGVAKYDNDTKPPINDPAALARRVLNDPRNTLRDAPLQ